jgi:hypothetical protein
MTMKNNIKFILTFCCSIFIIGCSPHSATGVWKATGDNELGISQLVTGFEGKVEFTATKPVKATWHCFWGAENENSLSLKCTPSTNPEKKSEFTLTVNDQGIAELKDELKILATFSRSDENPSPKK